MRTTAALAAAFLVVAGATAQSTTKQKTKAIDDLEKQGAASIPRIADYMKDEDPEVRRSAVASIVDLGGQTSLDPLVAATKDNDGEVQFLAVDGLVNYYLPGYVQKGFRASFKKAGRGIKGRFTDMNTQVIEPHLEPRATVLEALAELAKSGNGMDTRANAARGIGILRARAALPALYEAVKSKDTNVIYESLVAMQKIGDPASAPRISFLLNDLNDRVQIAAIETSGLLRNKEALPGLKEAMARARNAKIRRIALGAIAMIPDEGNRALYAEHLVSTDEGMRASAAEGYARLGQKSDLEAMVKAFEGETKMSPRLSMAFAAVMLGKHDTAEFSPLTYLVNTLNNSGYVGIARPFLIESARDADVRTKLYPGMSARTKNEKIELAWVLGVSGDKTTVPVLEELSKDGDSKVSLAATQALRVLRPRIQ